MRATPLLRFFGEMNFSMTANVQETVEHRRLAKLTLPIGSLWFTLLKVQTDNLNSKLPTQTQQLRHPASRTSFSDNTTSYGKNSICTEAEQRSFTAGVGNLSPVAGQKQTLQGTAGRTNVPSTFPFPLLLLNLGNSWNFNQINSWFLQFVTKAQNAT